MTASRAKILKPRPQLDWLELHRDCWVARITPGASVSVSRHRSWKRRIGKPWRIEVLGYRFVDDGHHDLDAAMVAAERHAVAVVAAAGRRLGLLPHGRTPRAR